MFLLYSATMEMSVEASNIHFAISDFHSGTVYGLSTCLRKQLIATSGVDKSLRLWNYANKTLDLIRFFPEECFGVALHPSGNLILAGFADKLRLMSILMDDYKLVKEIAIRACCECQFSTGGQYFAATGGNTTFIFKTYTCEQIAALRGHTGKVNTPFAQFDDRIGRFRVFIGPKTIQSSSRQVQMGRSMNGTFTK